MDNAIITNNERDTAKVKNNRLWFKRATVDFPLTDEQYEVFKKGYVPDWECRFAPVYMDGWFYITRSGFWLFKFKYEKKKDGLWHITANYDTPHTPGYSVMLNVIHEGYFEPQIFTERDMKRYLKALKESSRLPLPVAESPGHCSICHNKVWPVSIGEPTPETWRKIERGTVIDWGCSCDENYPDWACKHCGQTYKDIHDEWNEYQCNIIYSRRPKVCRKCGSPVLKLVYGFPTHEAFEASERGELILGGCCIEEDSPDMRCVSCHQGYKKFIPDYLRKDVFPDLLCGNRENKGDEDAALDMLTDDFGKLEAKIMGVYGAMARGLSKAEALAKYGLSEREYDANVNRVKNS